ncbi:M3 family metallopeptidase [Oceanobacillus halotolerans]|uniref:M3 family metallopeptidase n=1 Tax=Oceanobacillus halotolerans TaxID=2663380 RepID=UPI0013D9B2C7|nr:M3 family metallopeptidase [Oceanobacillus halotolerans]
MKQILRKDIPEEETWDLTPIFASVDKWEQSFQEVEKQIDNLLAGGDPFPLSTARELFDSLNDYDQLMERLNRVSSYAMYKFSEDESDAENQEIMGRSLSLVAKGGQVTTNFTNALVQVDKNDIDNWKKEEGGIHEFDRFLDRLDEVRHHTLTSDMENTLASLSETLRVPEVMFHAVTSSDMKFEPAKDKNGKEHPVSLHMYMTQIETSPDTVLRRNAYQSLTNGLKNYQHTLGKSLTSEITKNISLAKLRGYDSAKDMLLQYSDPNQFYATDAISSSFFGDILDTFQKELSPHMQRYARLRKRQLGLDKLQFSDVKAPLDPEFDPPIRYKEAGEIITDAVGVLGPEYQNEMARVFSERWVYRGDNVGRRMIAFGGGVHGVHGYSFYPWGGNLFDMLLLGHELGHTLHFSLSMKNQRYINNTQAHLFVEAPSTLVEQLIVDYLKENRDDPRLKRWLNMYLMMSYHHNCVTHVLEAELMRRLYDFAENNQPLSTAIISKTKGAILSEFWGDTVEIDEGANLTWMRQPHYYMGLYPFTYSVGISASTVMAERIQKEGQAIGKQWTEVLKQGGNKSGLDLYRMAGLEMSTTENLKKAIARVGTIVDELEASFQPIS